MAEDKSFLGSGWAFPPRFDNKDAETIMVSDDKDIHESLYIILTTSPGERIMNPQFGCGIRSLVFESITESMLTVLKDMIQKSILFFEPRITLDAIEIDTDSVAEGILYINLFYTIRMTNTRSNMVYPYYFIEGTNIQQ